MSQMNVTQFASELKMPASALLEQLQKAGVSKQEANDTRGEGQDHADAQENHGNSLGGCQRQVAHHPGRSAQEARAGASRYT